MHHVSNRTTNDATVVPPRFFERSREISEEIGRAWAAAWLNTGPAASTRAPRAINPRRGR